MQILRQHQRYSSAMEEQQKCKKRKQIQVSPNFSKIRRDSSASAKGKTPVIEEKDLECGICLTGSSLNPRGKMDSCEHYYCFVCIREWAKVETRCPACRRRFQSILRVDLNGKSRCFRVPKRDQVYLGDDENGEGRNVYEHVFCIECGGDGDEDLLLLCDRCDSAAHTYCVGLGRTVPLGDWYCKSCGNSDNSGLNTQQDVLTATGSEVSSDATATLDPGDYGDSETLDETVITPEILVQEPVHRRRPVLGSTGVRIEARQATRTDERSSRRGVSRAQANKSFNATSSQGSDAVSCNEGRTVGTVTHRRMLQDRIQRMRDTWHALQTGRQHFPRYPFSLNNTASSSGRQLKASHLIGDCSQGNDRCVSQNDLEDQGQGGHNVTAEIDRAWKMMELAKGSLQKDKISHDVLSSSTPVKGQKFLGTQTGSSKICLNANVGTDNMAGMLQHTNHKLNGLCPRSTPSSSGSPSAIFKAPSVSGIDRKQENQCQAASSSMQQRGGVGATVGPLAERQIPVTIQLKTGSASSLGSKSFLASNQLAARSHECQCFPSCSVDNASSAKEKVLSAVRAHLNPIYKSKRLGSEKFKEIARISTHTILSACGYEHFRKGAKNIEPMLCSHSVEQTQSPSLMPMCCSHCFNLFLKQVVENVVKEVT